MVGSDVKDNKTIMNLTYCTSRRRMRAVALFWAVSSNSKEQDFSTQEKLEKEHKIWDAFREEYYKGMIQVVHSY